MEWNYIIHIGIISCSLLFAALIRARVRFFQRFLIPAPILGGIFMMLFYNFVAPTWGLSNQYLGELVYHLLNISFISMLLRVTGKPKDGLKAKRMLGENTTAVMSQYGLQCFFGLLATALLIAVYDKYLFPAIGFTLTLGF